MAPDQALTRRFISVVLPCPESARELLRRPVIRRLLMIAGFVIAGWLFGSAGHAQAATIPAPVAPVTGALGQAAHDTANMTANKSVHLLAETLPLRPGVGTNPLHVIGVQPPVNPGTVTTARTKTATIRRHHIAKVTAARSSVSESLETTTRITRHGPARQSHRSHRRYAAGASGSTHTTGHHRLPRPQPRQASSAGSTFAGLYSGSRHGLVENPPFITPLIIGAVPPAVRTAADEPSLSPD